MQERRLPPNIETAIFRIVQESLTNVIMHAQASRVDMVISRKDDTVAAIIEDNGVGFFPSLAMNGEHLGLFGMRERVEMLGGTLAIESEPGQGTIVKAEVPCRD
jgi:signal transduction histidine kinase